MVDFLIDLAGALVRGLVSGAGKHGLRSMAEAVGSALGPSRARRHKTRRHPATKEVCVTHDLRALGNDVREDSRPGRGSYC